jgi:hypothetical protein
MNSSHNEWIYWDSPILDRLISVLTLMVFIYFC